MKRADLVLGMMVFFVFSGLVYKGVVTLIDPKPLPIMNP
jgi:hypothetical protein